MKKYLFLMIALPMACMFSSCGSDDEEDAPLNTVVVVKEDGTTSNGSIFSAIDDKNFYLDYIKYTVKEGHLVVSSYDGAGFKGAAKIVSKITFKGNTYEVLSIGENAFDLCTGLTSITIPNSVTSIGASAFSGCTGLTSITIPNSVTSIGASAFRGCTGLTSITIPNSVTSIGEGAFRNCTVLTSITIPNSVTSIGENAFWGCSGIENITVSSDNPKYDSRDNCNAIIVKETNSLIVGCKKSTIPNSVTSIGWGAFSSCTGLTSITIPNSVTSIGNYSFRGCTGLTSITIGSSVKSIGFDTFSGCTGLTSIHCLATSPPYTEYNAFDNRNYSTATLYVPKGSLYAYEHNYRWGDFHNIVEE